MSNINYSTAPEDIIQTTQKIRLQIVDTLTTQGNTIPDDPKFLSALNQTLRDMDQAAQTTQKLNIEAKAVDDAAQTSANINALLRHFGGKNPFLADPNSNLPKAERVTDDAALLPTVVPVPKQDLQGVDHLEYSDFVQDPS